jgi:2-polyprenyl-3-methyl-5-hydroxy-6-metoxy-1,4-benzoquinol methylase
MGGQVLGIDLSDEGLAVAQAHAARDPLLETRIR